MLQCFNASIKCENEMADCGWKIYNAYSLMFGSKKYLFKFQYKCCLVLEQLPLRIHSNSNKIHSGKFLLCDS